MPKAIRFYQPDGPEVLVWEEVPVANLVRARRACATPPST